jgi:hypothetical protein
MTAVLDTKSWTWIIPQDSPFQPFPRAHAIASIVNDTKMVFGFGKKKNENSFVLLTCSFW